MCELVIWVLAGAARRGTHEEVSGVYLGGYGWVENLVPAQPKATGPTLTADEQRVIGELDAALTAEAANAPALPPVQPLTLDNNGGFLHVPSAA